MADNAAVKAHGFAQESKYEGGWMIPPPLKPGTRYDGTVTWTSGLGQITQTFSFTTAVAENRIELYHTVRAVHIGSVAPDGSVVFYRNGRTLRIPIKTRSSTVGYELTVPVSRLAAGTWRVCVHSGGGSSGYQPKKTCIPLYVRNGRTLAPGEANRRSS